MKTKLRIALVFAVAVQLALVLSAAAQAGQSDPGKPQNVGAFTGFQRGG